MSRRYLNLVLYDFERGTYPVCRIDFCKHLFNGNSEIAQIASGENKIKRGAIDGRKKLPRPAINFQPTTSWLNSRMVYLFSLLGGEGNILYADGRCPTVLYNFDMKFIQSIPSPNSCKSPNVISASIPQLADPTNERESLHPGHVPHRQN
jgi:prepilin-type processing-associated H-X9-DG protein